MTGGFVAQFRGRCVECDQAIEIGDEIGAITGQGYQHIHCPDAPDERPTKYQGTTLEEMGF